MEFFENYWRTTYTVALILIPLVFFLGHLAKKRGIGIPAKVPLDIANGKLIIDGTRYGGPVPLSALLLDQSRLVELDKEGDLQPLIRTLGIGSKGYKSGWFKLKNGKDALVFLTDESKVIYLPTRSDYVLLLSVNEPDEFLGSIRAFCVV